MYPIKVDSLIDGEKRHNTTKTYEVEAPVDRSVIGSAPDADEKDVNDAVAAAAAAFKNVWADYDAVEREKLFWRWAEIIEKRADELGAVHGKEGGGASAADGYRWTADYIRYFAGYATKNYGDLTKNDESLCYVVKEPLGPVAVFPSWNTGGTGALVKIAPALIAGNTIVLRAAAETPLATLMIADTVIEAGFPAGVINILAGSDRTSAQQLINHPDIKFVSYTGNVPVGQYIVEKSAPSFKHVGLELGGKSPFIVFPDVDIEETANKAMDVMISYQGQICSAPSRILVHESIKEEFLAALKARAEAYSAADPDAETEGLTYGPLFNKRRLDSIEEYVEIGKKEGKLIAGGNRVQLDAPLDKGYYYEPTIFEFEEDNSVVTQEEIFGPVTCVFSFKDEEEALHLANNVDFALAASLWTHDQGRIQRFTQKIEAGTVWVRGHNQWDHHNPWGGPKLSGMGREWGKYVLDHYYDLKCVWINS